MKLAFFKNRGYVLNWGLVLIIALAAYLIWKMVFRVRESFEGVYSGAGGATFAAADEGFFAVSDQAATLDTEAQPQVWGDGTPVAPTAASMAPMAAEMGHGYGHLGTSAPPQSDKFSTLLVEPAFGSEGANAMFQPTVT